MDSLKCVYICLVFLTVSKRADAAIGGECSACDGANNEVCDTDNTNVCICDAGSGYSAGPTATDTCFLTVNLGDSCTANDECELGDGGAGTVCSSGSSICVTPLNLGDSCTSDDECVEGDGGAGTVCSSTCVTPKNIGDACTADNQCEVGDGGAGTVCDSLGDGNCKKDCGIPTNPTGYTLTASSGTLAGDTATVACAAGYSGTPNPAAVACQAGGTWATPAGCIAECGNPAASTGYIPGPPDTTAEDGTASVSCDTANGYTGTAASITCQADGTWSDYSGCSASGNGASDIRQTCSIITVIGSFVITLMYI